jgi:uncharacterized protein with GYD domain
MAYALGLTKYTSEATKALIAEGPVALAEYVSRMCESQNMKVHGYWFAEGPDADVVLLVEVPDEMRADPAASIAVQALNWSSGMAESMRVIWLTTPEDLQAALATTVGLAAAGEE